MMNFNRPRGMMGMMPSAQPQGGTPKQHNDNRTYAGQYFSDVMQDGDGQYANYDFGEPDKPGQRSDNFKHGGKMKMAMKAARGAKVKYPGGGKMNYKHGGKSKLARAPKGKR